MGREFFKLILKILLTTTISYMIFGLVVLLVINYLAIDSGWGTIFTGIDTIMGVSSPIFMCQFLIESPAQAGACLKLDAGGCDCTV